MTQAEWTRGTEKVIQCEVVNTEMEPSTGWHFMHLEFCFTLAGCFVYNYDKYYKNWDMYCVLCAEICSMYYNHSYIIIAKNG